MNLFIYNPYTKVLNEVREPVCSRGGPVTSSSVTGTGPGASCREPPVPPPPPPPPPLRNCKINVNTQSIIRYRAGQGGINRIVC